MIPKRYIELMNRELDGANSAAESADLKRYLDSDGEGREHFDDLRGLAGMFASAGPVAAPLRIDELILSSIAEREGLRAPRNRRASLGDLLSPRRKLAYAFAAGIAVGLIILVVFYRSLSDTVRLDVDDLYGTFAARENPGKLLSAESLEVRAAGVAGHVTIRYLERGVVAEISLSADRKINVILTNSGTLFFEGVRTRETASYGMTARDGAIEISCTGRCGYLLEFTDGRGAHPPVSVRIQSDGMTIFNETIRPGQK